MKLVLCIALLAGSGSAFAQTQQAQQGLIGNWMCKSPLGQAPLDINPGNSLSFDGQPMQYVIQGNVVTVIQNGVRRPHTFALQGGVLNMQSPEGIPLRCERTAGGAAGGAAGGMPGGGGLQGGANHLLSGMLCGSSGSYNTGGSYQRNTRVRFDGQGRFVTGGDSSFSGGAGLGYGQAASDGGTYRVTGAQRGALIQVRWNNGEEDSATVHHVVNGRITEIMYGKQLLGMGLC